jgi:DNA segregation ATPase FtsK/SpoIIIE-like protein
LALAILAFRLRPELRAGLDSAMRENRRRRWLNAALWHCAVIGRNGDIPRVVRSASLPVGCRYLISLPVGLHFEAMKSREAELAAALSVREVRVKPYSSNARYVEFAIIWSNAFPKSITSPLLQRQSISLWDPVPFGVGQDGLAVVLHLPEHNLLIGGEPGSGKSVALSTIVASAALDPTVHLTLLDGKDVELVTWSKVADRFVGATREEAVEVLEEVVALMDERYQRLVATRKRKVAPGDLEGLHVIVIDEVAFYLRGGEKATRDRFAELLRDPF